MEGGRLHRIRSGTTPRGEDTLEGLKCVLSGAREPREKYSLQTQAVALMGMKREKVETGDFGLHEISASIPHEGGIRTLNSIVD